MELFSAAVVEKLTEEGYRAGFKDGREIGRNKGPFYGALHDEGDTPAREGEFASKCHERCIHIVSLEEPHPRAGRLLELMEAASRFLEVFDPQCQDERLHAMVFLLVLNGGSA